MNNINLSAKDNNNIVQADVGSTITISLDANATTGYLWKLDGIDEAVIQNTDSGFKNITTTAQGAANQQYFTFKLLQTGQSKISLKYLRGWQGDVSVNKRFEVKIEVV